MSNVSLHRPMSINKTKCSHAMRIIFASIFLCFLGSTLRAAVIVTPAGGGTNICHNRAADGTSPAYTGLGTITVTEGAADDFNPFIETLVINVPAGWQFNTAATPTLNSTGGDIFLVADGGFSSTALTVTMITLGTGSIDAITITGLQIQPLTQASAPGNITASIATNINGIATSVTNFGSLSQTGPAIFTVSSPSGYCAGTPGAAITLSGSQTGVNYQLYNSGAISGGPIPGTGAAPFDLGIHTAGSYTVRATDGTGCTSNMLGTAAFAVDPLPSVFAVGGGGSYCPGGAGVNVTLSSSDNGVVYTASNGVTSSTLPGSLGPLTFGPLTSTGTYTVLAQNATTGCTAAMSGSATVSLFPAPAQFTVTGATSYCASAGGVNVGLSGSVGSTTYQLYNGLSTVGAPLSGTGGALDFGLQPAGSYSVLATLAPGGCTSPMLNTLTVTSNPDPTVFNVGGGGSYCAGAAGVNITLSSSQVGVVYTATNGVVSTILGGTGVGLAFGPETSAGTYSVSAQNGGTGCSATMNGTATVTLLPSPAQFTITGATSYCASTGGVNIGLSGSEATMTYQLYNGPATVGGPVPGSGTTLDFGLQPAGAYSVLATAPGGCTRAMLNTLTVTSNPQPTVFNVGGGGPICSGGAGVNVTLSSSEAGVVYTATNGIVSTVVGGTGSSLTFGPETSAGTYSVSAQYPVSGCSAVMNGTAVVTLLPSPAQFTVTGATSYCAGGAGVAIGLSGSVGGTTYQLYNGLATVGGVVPGTGVAISFGTQPAGTYSVLATLGSCTSPMLNTLTVTADPLPNVYNVGGGGPYCTGGAGVNVTLSNSDIGINYTASNGVVSTTLPGAASSLTFGPETSVGTYTILATNASTGCTSVMNGSATVTTVVAPAQFTVTGATSYCAGGTGVVIGLSGSQTGTNYQLYDGAVTAGAPVPGSGGAIDFGFHTAGSYSVLATVVAGGCIAPMLNTLTVTTNPLPTAYAVGGGGGYCVGSPGVNITLSNSDIGINYQLYNGAVAVGGPVAGTGVAPLVMGLVTAGTYTVSATDPATGCTNAMSGSASAFITAGPTVYEVSGGGGYCIGGPGDDIVLSGSQIGASYQLYFGSLAQGAPLPGTGGLLDFGFQTAVGIYSVQASIGSCTSDMYGVANVSLSPLPIVYTLSGGGGYCEGTAGIPMVLNGSEAGVNYQLYLGAVPIGSPVAGTGAPTLSLGMQTLIGTYSVVATNPTTLCTSNMLGTATVTINPLPALFTVGGGGNYCIGGPGVMITLSNSEIGIDYQLYRGSSPVAGPVAGTGVAPLNMGIEMLAGVYTVSATNPVTGCMQNMFGSATVSVNPLPLVFDLSSGGSFCAGDTGIDLTLSGSQPGVLYQLYNGATATGSPIGGTGGVIDFGFQNVGGTYSVLATNPTTGCSIAMNGSAVLTENPLPLAFTVGGGGSYCAGGAGVAVTLNNSQLGINYQLYRGATAVGGVVGGTNIPPLDMGIQTVAGTYSVLATDPATGCSLGMTGSVTVSINPLPNVYTISAGGSYCAGDPGVDVVLSGSDTGVSYQLYFGAVATGSPVAGTGTTIDFGFQTGVGTYSVLATNNTTLCTNNMAGIATITSNPVPLVFSLSLGGSYCEGGAGVDLILNGSETGINYQLYYGAATVDTPVAGTGLPTLDLGFQTLQGTYTVLATNPTTLCHSDMLGVATVSINPLPAVHVVGGGGSYCAGDTGVHITLNNSDIGINYQLYNGSSPIGGPVAGTGVSPLDMGLATLAGTYTVSATNVVTGCMQDMFGSATVSINPLPATFNVTGGGAYCVGGTGVPVGLDGSLPGTSYQLYAAGSPVGSALAGTGFALDFGLQTATVAYTVIAQDTTTLCVNTMNGSVTVTTNPLPTAYNLSAGGSYCAGGPGVDLTLDGSDTGISYQLYFADTAIGAPVAGTGTAPLDLGFQTGAGSYFVIGTNTVTGCVDTMNNTAVISIDPLPNVYNVIGGGSYCFGDTGLHVMLDNSDTGINYQLFVDGVATGGLVAGTGTVLDMGLETVAGAYTVLAINATTGCSNNMSGSATVSINPLPGVFNMTGGGSACFGAPGVPVGLDGSATGISYQLYVGGVPTGAPLAGTGSALDFGLQTTMGVYIVVATDTTTLCTNNMNGVSTVIINPLPTVFNMTGGGAYCAGGTGVSVGLDGSVAGVSYQLIYLGSPTGAPLAGTGFALDFGLQTGGGDYTVVATDTATLCTNNMAGTATVTVNPLPTAFNVTGGGEYCVGGTGYNVGIDGSETGILYTLFLDGFPVGSPMVGTGFAIDFGVQSAGGVYSVMAGNMTTGCFNSMNNTVSIVVNPLPIAYNVTGGGTMCAGTPGFDIQLSNSETGVNYQLYINTLPYGAPIGGTTGSPVDFGVLAFPGTYLVVGTNATTGCIALMTDSAVIIVNPTPGPINGVSEICSNTSTLLTDTSAGGVWTSNDYSIASVDASGVMTGINAGVTTITYSFATGCNATFDVTIDATPAAFTVTGGGSLCAGGAGFDVALSGSELTVTYQLYINTLPYGTPVAGTGSAIDFGVFDVPGSYYIVGTNASGTCNALMTDSALIILNPSPGPINGLTSICVNSSTTLTDTAAGGVWSSNDFMIASIDAGGVMTGINGGVTTITYTLPSTCYATADVTVNSLPIVAAITGVTNECVGSSSLLADATTGGIWSSTDTSIATIDASGMVTGMSAGIVTISYTVTDGFGCVGAATTADTVNTIPVVPAITGEMSVCVNATVTLSDDMAGGVWSSGDVTIATIDPVLGKLTGVTAGTVDITYTVTGASGCTGFATSVATVNGLPSVDTITGLTSVCAGFTIMLTDATIDGTWSSSDMAVATVNASGMVTGIAPGTATIYYTVSNTLGCMNMAARDITVGNAITGVAILPGGNVTHCGGAPINLVVSTTDTTLTYQWSINGFDIAGATNGSYIADSVGYFTVTLNNGTCNATITGTDVIAPPNPIISYNSTGNYLYTSTYATYQWYRNGTLIPGATSSILSSPGAGIYKVVVSDANGCFVTSGNYTVTGGGTNTVDNTTPVINIRVFPNPATSTLSIEASVTVNVVVVSPDGKVVMEQKQATSLNVSNLADGMYMIMLYDEQNSLLKVEKFAKTNN